MLDRKKKKKKKNARVGSFLADICGGLSSQGNAQIVEQRKNITRFRESSMKKNVWFAQHTVPFIIGRGICFKFVSSWGKIPMNSLALKKKSAVRLFYICYQTFRLQILQNQILQNYFPSFVQFPFFILFFPMNIECYEDFPFFFLVSFDSTPESNSKIHIEQCQLKIPIVNRENPIQPNWVSVPRRWESGRVLDTRKENDYNGEFGQVMFELPLKCAILILNQSQFLLNSHTCHIFHIKKKIPFRISY